MKNPVSPSEVVESYRKGRRDFSNVSCVNGSFEGLDLRGIIFKKSNLAFCSFRNANLEGSDLSEADLEWTNFTRANLAGAKLNKCRAVWSVFNEAVFDKTEMHGADLSWSLFFNANLLGGADLTNATIATIATRPEEITEEGLKKLKENIGNFHGQLDYELWLRLKFATGNTAQAAVKIRNMAGSLELRYGKSHSGYEANKEGVYTAKGEWTNQQNYGPVSPYVARRKPSDRYF